MRILLDTHIFLWSALEPEKVSLNARNAINHASAIYLSIASVWEMQIKFSLGKLPLVQSVSEIVARSCAYNSIDILPIEQDHIYRLADLPHHHGDPFDRMLIAQAQHETLTLVTADKKCDGCCADGGVKDF